MNTITAELEYKHQCKERIHDYNINKAIAKEM